MGLVLGLRSWYSKTGGFLSPAAAVCAAKGQGAQAVAFADVNELGGTLEWLEACEKNQVMPIAGIEVGLNDQDEVRQALLFARGRDGMQRLFAVVSAADSDGDGLITTPEEGAWKNLVFCSGGAQGHLHTLISQRDLSGCSSFLARIRQTGARLLIGLDPDLTDPYTLSVYRKLSLEHAVVPYRAALYEKVDDHILYNDVARVIGNGPLESYLSDLRIRTFGQWADHAAKRGGFSFHRRWERILLREEYDCRGSLRRVIEAGKLVYQGLKGEDCDQLLKQETARALTQRWSEGVHDPGALSKYQERLDHELEAAKSLGISGYLLHLRDVAETARNMAVPLGQGRGSSVNSLLCYLLRVTAIDPVRASLPFERFLNINRAALPDVDIDVGRKGAAQFRERIKGEFEQAYSLRTFSHPTLRAFLQKAMEQRGVDPKKAGRVVAWLEAKYGKRWDFRGVEDLAERDADFVCFFTEQAGGPARANGYWNCFTQSVPSAQRVSQYTKAA